MNYKNLYPYSLSPYIFIIIKITLFVDFFNSKRCILIDQTEINMYNEIGDLNENAKKEKS